MGAANRALEPHSTYFTSIGQRTLGTGFFDEACKDFYLRRLLQCQNAFHVRLHAYLLLDRRIFLMFTPQTPLGFSAFINFLCESYNIYYSVRFERQVEAWRNSASVCQLPNDILVRDCQKFIERFSLNIENSNHLGEYPYSSYCANAFSLRPAHLKRHQAMSELLSIEGSALARYREFIATPFREEYERFLCSRLLNGCSLVGKRARNRLEKRSTLTDIDKRATIARDTGC